jgi:arylsulfatase A-like enzyme
MRKMKPLKRFLTALGFLCAFVVLSSHSGQAERPNVILIVTDDQGYGDVSAHGSPVLKTPNVDKLRSQSVSFTDFHVAPMCSPTRGQLMTGLDAMRNGCTAVCQGRSMMRAELPTMADFFADSGYATGHFGKWHLGDSYPHRPQDRGFQENLHHRAWGITSLADYWGNTYFDPMLEHNGKDKKYQGYCTDIFFSEAMKWIGSVTTKNQEQGTKKPFFLYLPTNTPHVPDVCADEYSDPYVGKHEGKVIPSKFYGMIANLDENFGKLEAFLIEKNLRDNTLLIYMADNGTQSRGAQEIFNAGMRARKTSVYEGGHRVPLFVRWPNGDLQHGSSIDALTQVQDILPTLIEMCGLRNKNSKFDGMSLAGLLTGTETKLPDRKLVTQYRVSGEPWDPAVVMWDKWRLLKEKKGRRPQKRNLPLELYHVGRDPGQKRNVAAKFPEVVASMKKHYEEWHAEAKKLYARERWITVGSQQANPVILYSQDWVGDYCDNPKGLSQATAQGYWNINVDRAGTYEVELRRWPKESKKTLTEGWNGPRDRGDSARPIAAANLKVAKADLTQDTKPTDTHAAFSLRLPVGKMQLATTFLDKDGEGLCSAIYVYVRRIENTASLIR